MEMEAVREQGNEHGLELVIGELGWSRAVARASFAFMSKPADSRGPEMPEIRSRLSRLYAYWMRRSSNGQFFRDEAVVGCLK